MTIQQSWAAALFKFGNIKIILSAGSHSLKCITLTKKASIYKIEQNIRRKRLCIFSAEISFALKNIVTHCHNRNINVDNIHQQQRHLFPPLRYIQEGVIYQKRRSSIKTANKQKTDFLIYAKPKILQTPICFHNHFTISFKQFLSRTASNSLCLFEDKIFLSEIPYKSFLSTSGIPG